MIVGVVTISFLLAAIALVDWRKGLLALLALGVIQDLMRKLTPGIPPEYQLWSTAAFMGVVAVAFFRRDLASPQSLTLHHSALRTVWLAFAALVAVQAVHTIARWGDARVALLGLFFYYGAPVAALAGASYASSTRNLRSFMSVYVLIFAPASLTVYLSAYYPEQWDGLREVGSFVGAEMLIYDVGTVLRSYSGLFRVGEIAAWHAATAVVFIMILIMTTDRRVALRRAIGGIVVVALIGAILLTGRRKMLMTLTLFLTIQWFLLMVLRQGWQRLSLVVLVLGLFGSLSLTLLDPGSTGQFYVARGASVFADALDRLQIALNLMLSAIRRSQGLGLGAGVSAQGVQYAGEIGAVGGAAEAGLGKIIIELGIAGLVLIALILWLSVGRIVAGLRRLGRAQPELAYYQASMVAFLLANLGTFMVATQVFGDLFVLLMLGLVGGFVVRLHFVPLQAGQARAVAA